MERRSQKYLPSRAKLSTRCDAINPSLSFPEDNFMRYIGESGSELTKKNQYI